MLRAIILSLVLFLVLGAIIPMATEYTEATSVQQTKRKYKKKRRSRKYKRYRRVKRSLRRCRTYRNAPSCKRFMRWYKRRSKNSKRYRKSSRRRVAKRYRKKSSRRYKKRYRKSSRRYKKSRKYTSRRKVRRKKRVRKHSKKWWRAYRARKAKRASLARRKRALRLRRIRLAKKKRASKRRRYKRNRSTARRKVVAKKKSAVILPSGERAPLGWVQDAANSRELRFNVDGGNGSQIGSASLTVLGPASSKSTNGWRKNTVGGVSTTTLRRTVIDQMVRENGWVENDFQKEIGGKKVYVVVAKSPDAGNRVQSRTFYFTEANGRIYSLATKAPKEDSEKIVKQSEKVIESLQNKKRVQQAKNK